MSMSEIVQVDNYINGSFVPLKSYLDVVNPSTGAVIGKVGISTSNDVEAAVAAANAAYPAWSALTIKARASIMLKFHALVREHATELAELIVLENGKNMTEALADVAKGNETVEYACSLPQLAQGKILRVSGAVSCLDERRSLGVVASIVPFNFPFMVPMWTFPIALVMGNCFILKPSEKVPLTMRRVASLVEQAGFPKGVFNMVQGSKDAVQALITHDDVKAVTFVGSSPVAKLIASACKSHNKRCTALGGAKNHLVALPDCHLEDAASDIFVSFAGCAGQRCMAASVLLLVEPQDDLVAAIVDASKKIVPGLGPGEMGPVIDEASYNKIISYIQAAEQSGAKILLDGRSWNKTAGNWIGPTILLHKTVDKTMKEEVFGPVLSVYQCASWEEAIEIENSSPFGNAASIYTSSGASSEWFTNRFRAAMLGVNIGIPVPREPFSFGGLYGTNSKYGDMDITGDGAIEFFSNRK
jgi:malonate-semialdehyde dehydrogenase (acetylating)/methylmalonate-semialdehyde dehydrogenase